ncbi:excisionase family DNA-binding protein [Amycolatopsis suaedae]|uniref:Helix-turn-helix domain-containing protein n=1 Tax=Amycolatopsis suaedae TaxID=2510978 RepID=A0A4Q7J591_9PSEU|nr:excisionase family DNA-binding protein [Amycolatopsis suaedae]RZQ62247.1 helix-turn-helix domain-containing protein [Amycolatopsis suaedae]
MTTRILERKWYTATEVAALLGFGLSKTKMLIAQGDIRSVKDGRHRRILPRWVDEYIERRVQEQGLDDE